MVRDTTVDLGDLSLHGLVAGPLDGPSVLSLHGWPQSSHAFKPVMELLSEKYRVAAIDLPRVGKSAGQPGTADKNTLAGYAEKAIHVLGLRDVALVGNDGSGQIVYAYLREFAGTIKCAAILNVVLPGVAQWFHVIRSHQIRHFAFHGIPVPAGAPATNPDAEYLDFYFDAFSAALAATTEERRKGLSSELGSKTGSRSGIEWHGSFPQDETEYAAHSRSIVHTPLLFVRGDAEGGEMRALLDSLRGAGIANLTDKVLAHSGQFSFSDQPRAVAAAIREFIEGTPSGGAPPAFGP